MSTKQPDDQPNIPFRYLRRYRGVEFFDDRPPHTVDETVLQWLDPDGVWRDVPTVEEGKSDEPT